MSEPRIVRVSPHLLMDVASCESKAWTRHVKGFTSKGDAIKATAGQGFHKAMEVILDPQVTEFGEPGQRTRFAIEAFHNVYDDAFLRLSPEKLEPSLTPQNLDRVLRRWIEMHPPAMRPWKRVLAVEEAFVSREWTVAATGGDIRIQLIVRPDAIVEDSNDRIRWVDTKTTGWHIGDPSWKLALRLALQTQLYSDAVVQRYGEKAIYGGWINAIELRQLPSDPTRKCQTHKVVYAECGNEHAKAEIMECLTTPEKVAAAVREAEEAARQFALETTAEGAAAVQMNVRGTTNSTCRFCPAAQWCDSGRPEGEGALESYFVYEPWPISIGKRAA
jgi:hypothetical protein